MRDNPASNVRIYPMVRDFFFWIIRFDVPPTKINSRNITVLRLFYGTTDSGQERRAS
jgi:hypothetical protein